MAVDLGYMVLVGFGSLRITQFYKEVARRIGLHQVAWWKSAVNVVACVLLTLLIPHHTAQMRILIALGGSGLAGILHALETVLRARRDDLITAVVAKTGRRR